MDPRGAQNRIQGTPNRFVANTNKKKVESREANPRSISNAQKHTRRVHLHAEKGEQRQTKMAACHSHHQKRMREASNRRPAPRVERRAPARRAYYVILCYTMSHYVILCHTVSCMFGLCHTMSCMFGWPYAGSCVYHWLVFRLWDFRFQISKLRFRIVDIRFRISDFICKMS